MASLIRITYSRTGTPQRLRGGYGAFPCEFLSVASQGAHALLALRQKRYLTERYRRTKKRTPG